MKLFCLFVWKGNVQFRDNIPHLYYEKPRTKKDIFISNEKLKEKEMLYFSFRNIYLCLRSFRDAIVMQCAYLPMK